MGVKRNTSIAKSDKPDSRAASTAQISYHSAAVEGYGIAEFGGGLEPTVQFEYPDDGDEPAPRVRDPWRAAPLLDKCQQRFAAVPSGAPLTMPLLDKRLEVLRYALREAVESMDLRAIHLLVEKAIATAERIAREQLAAATPTTRELHDDIVIHDDADAGRVRIQFPTFIDARTKRWLRICGFMGSGDGATFWRRRTFRRGENIALDHARHCVQRILTTRRELHNSAEAAHAREVALLCA